VRHETMPRMTTAPERARVARGNIVFAFALALALLGAWLVRDVLVLLYVSALFAVVLSPVVRATSKLQVGRRRPFHGPGAILLLVVVLVLFVAAFCGLAFPPIVRDLQTFSGEMPARLPSLLAKLRRIPFSSRIETGQ